MSLSEAKLLDDVRRRLFAPVKSKTPRAVGVEIELIPLHAKTRRPALARSVSGPSTADIISRLAKRHGWLEETVESDPPSWKLPDGTRISFEPGGQIEISSAPHAIASSVIDSTQALVAVLHAAMATESIELLARGVDPYNDIDAVPLQLHRDRYQRMTRYFESIGPSGVRMMRQTAAIQINLERGDDPQFRWRLLNDLAPIVTALFANSRNYAGKSTEWASYRSHLWRTLDPSRTGIIYAEPGQAEKYLSFALDAFAMHSGGDGQPYRTFREWMHEPGVNEAEWLFHLSTLFPEVRPKEYFELRSADTIEPAALCAPVVFVTGLVYDEESAKSATELLGVPDPVLLLRAGKRGLQDREVWRLASALCEFAIEGAVRLGESYISARHREKAGEYLKTLIGKFRLMTLFFVGVSCSLAAASLLAQAAPGKTILAIGAHAGDMELTAGALLIKQHKLGDRVVILQMTLGEGGNPRLSPSLYGAQKRREALAADSIIGAETIFAPYRDGEIPNDEATRRYVADVIRTVKPTYVITHWSRSIHKDHSNTSLIVQDAVLLASLEGVVTTHPVHRGIRGVFYADNWEDAESFAPFVYIDVTNEIAQWRDAVAKYEFVGGKISSFRYLDYYDALSTVRGAISGKGRAEAFDIDSFGKRRVLDSLP